MGTLFEGETILVLAALAARRGYLSLDGVVLCALMGAVVGDQLAFHAGRWRGERILERWPRLNARIDRVRSPIERQRSWLVVVFRFSYGLRVILPLLWGMGSMSAWRFLALDLLAAALWVAVVAGLSWMLGGVVEVFLADLQRYETVAFAIVAGVGVSVWCWRWMRSRGA